jgi:hypothetical protein
MGLHRALVEGGHWNFPFLAHFCARDLTELGAGAIRTDSLRPQTSLGWERR